MTDRNVADLFDKLDDIKDCMSAIDKQVALNTQSIKGIPEAIKNAIIRREYFYIVGACSGLVAIIRSFM